MRVAALDLGSNSLSLLVADVSETSDIRMVVREKVVLGLGAVVANEGSIPPDSIGDVVTAVTRFRAVIDAEAVDVVTVCATSAFRDAKNGTTVAHRVGKIIGSPVRIISGAEEAALVFRAVQASVLLDPSPAAGLDLGGGSLELTLGDHRGLRWSDSLALGAGRLTAELVRHDPLSRGDVRRLTERIEAMLAPAVAELEARHPQAAHRERRDDPRAGPSRDQPDYWVLGRHLDPGLGQGRRPEHFGRRAGRGVDGRTHLDP